MTVIQTKNRQKHGRVTITTTTTTTKLQWKGKQEKSTTIKPDEERKQAKENSRNNKMRAQNLGEYAVFAHWVMMSTGEVLIECVLFNLD